VIVPSPVTDDSHAPVPPLSPEFVALQRAVAGRYSLERELGRGGMGIVFLARDVALDRPVAIKLLPPSLAVLPDLRARFLREARTAAGLSHPNIVPIHAVDHLGDMVFFVMGFVDGESLGQRVRRGGPLTPSAVVRVVQEIAWALAYAHGRGVIHRDIKPDNILIEKGSGRALVTDFGIARLTDQTGVTGKGEILGTVHYMSPEQASGDATDGRSDLYSLGVTAYYALTGTLPFDGDNLPAVISSIVTQPAPDVGARRRGVPPRLAEAIDRCLVKTPAQRFPSGEALAEAVAAAHTAPYEPAPQIRHLIRVARELDIWLGFLLLLAYLAPTLVRTLLPTEPGSLVWIGIMLGAQLIAAPATLLSAMRRVLTAGLGPADVRVALEHAVASRLEEDRMIHGDSTITPPPERRAVWRAGGLGLSLGGGGWIAIASILGLGGTSLLQPAMTFLAIGIVMLVGSGFMSLFARPQASAGRDAPDAWPNADPLSSVRALQHVSTGAPRRRAIGLGLRLLDGRIGRGLFRLMGTGLHVPQQNLPPATERTELLLGGAAEALYRALPSDVRKRFPGVPDAVDALQRDAGKLRERVERLSQARADAAPVHAPGAVADKRAAAITELSDARDAARDRLAAAVAALENIRLDLLRLRAGVGSTDDLTADLEAVQQLSEEIDAELAGRREVRSLLRDGR